MVLQVDARSGGNRTDRMGRPLIMLGLFVCWLVHLSGTVTWGMLLKKSDFEQANMNGWIVFRTPNGTVGESKFPNFSAFDVTGDGVSTSSLQFQVGQQQPAEGRVYRGGGISTQLHVASGKLSISLDVAATYRSQDKERNLAGGRFEILFDDRVLTQYDIGPIPNGSTLRQKLHAGTQVTEGNHEIRIRITRPFGNHQSPFQFIDNILVIQDSE